MKKVFCFLCVQAFLLSAAALSYAQSVNAGNFTDFNNAVASSATATINLTGDITVSGDINTQASNDLTVAGNGHGINGNNYNTFFNVSKDQKLLFSTITAKNFARSSYSSSGRLEGGVIYSTGNVNFYNAAFTSNTAISSNTAGNASVAGGVLFSSGGSVNVNGVLLSGNNASAFTEGGGFNSYAAGGGIFNYDSSITIDGSGFEHNTAVSISSGGAALALGGAVYNETSSTTVFALAAAFSSNSVYSSGFSEATALGGAVYNSTGVINSINSVFQDNSATAQSSGGPAYAAGGSIYNNSFNGTGISTATKNYFTGSFAYAEALSSATALGGAIYNGDGTFNLSGSSVTNSYAAAKSSAVIANALGGAVYNAGSMTVSLGHFENTYASAAALGDGADAYAHGGAVFNIGAFKVERGSFTANFAIASSDNHYAEALGGAIYTESETTISGGIFNSNYSSASALGPIGSATALGGAVYSSSGIYIDNGIFENNKIYANALPLALASGGAVNLLGSTDISTVTFTNNSAYAFSQEGLAFVTGGAVSNQGRELVNIYSSSFTGNSSVAATDSGTAHSYGGAVYNMLIMNIHDSEFSNNSASYEGTGDAFGGAVFNEGVMTIYNSKFINNSALTSGGAVYNNDLLNIIADGGLVEFTGNTANGISNAIYNNGTLGINFNSGSDGLITVNDAITGNDTVININQTGTWDMVSSPSVVSGNGLSISAPTDGTVTFNNSVTGNSINIYNSGTLKLGLFEGVEDSENEGSYITAPSRGSIGTISDRHNFTINDTAVFDMANSMADDVVYVNNFTVNGTPSLKMDVDLANMQWDKIDTSGSASGSGTINLNKIRILSDFSGGTISSDIGIFVNAPSSGYFAGTDFYTYGIDGNSKYHITEGSNYSSINILFTGTVADIFQDAILQPGSRSIILASTYTLSAGFDNNVASGTLTVEGDNTEVAIDGNGISNIFAVSSDAGLDLSNIIVVGAQSAQGGVIYNEGNVILNGITFTGNIAGSSLTTANTGLGGAIFNASSVSVNSSYFEGNSVIASSNAFAGSIYNTPSGFAEIAASSFTGNSAVSSKYDIDDANDVFMSVAGGSLYNSGEMNVRNSYFSGNISSITVSVSSVAVNNMKVSAFVFGGAVYNESVLDIDNTSFSNNLAIVRSEGKNTDAFAFGGAVYNSSVANISNSKFINNYATATISVQNSSASALGGAVYTASGAVTNITNSVFENNKAIAYSDQASGLAYAYGGAVYNAGVTNIYNSTFKNNTAHNVSLNGVALGGAIFNASGATLNIIADGKNVEFSGNYENSRTNAIYNEDVSSVINLNAVSGSEIIMGDAIYATTGLGGTVNINQTGTWDNTASPDVPNGNNLPVSAPTDGTITLNNYIRNNDIHLYNGTLYVGKSGSIGSDSNRSDFTMYNASVLDLMNGSAGDTVYVKNFTVESNSVLKIEVDLAGSKWDKINVSSETLGSGTLDISSMKILSDFTAGVSKDVNIFVNPSTVDYFQNPDFYIYRYRTDVSSSIYHITQTNDLGTLSIVLEGYDNDTFQNAITTTVATRVVQLESDYYTPSAFNPVVSAGSLTVRGGDSKGNAVTIDGAQYTNIFVVQDDTVNLMLSNVIIKNGTAAEGGAIYNAGYTEAAKMTFYNNIAASSSGVSMGGAVYNSDTFIANGVSFTSNTAKSTFTYVYGGALYNTSSATIYNSSFIGNTVSGSTDSAGGAIFNSGLLNIVAQGGNAAFSGNKANGVSNSIHSYNGAVTNLNAALGYYITIGDNLTSEGDNNLININKAIDIDTGTLNAFALVAAPTSGTVILNADMTKFGNINSAAGNTVNLYNGTLKLSADAVFFSDVNFSMFAGSTFDMMNGKIDNIAVKDINLPDSGAAYVNMDVDLRNSAADSFIGTHLDDNNGTLVIKNMNIWKDVSNLDNYVSILIADDQNLKDALVLDSSLYKVTGPIFIYDVNYNDGVLGFAYGSDYNPSIFIAPISMQIGGYLGQLNNYSQAFEMVYDNVNDKGRKGLWVKPYVYDEDVSLNSKLKVSNFAYGAFFGYDTEKSDIGGNFDGNFSIYGGINNSQQKYEGSEINQDGGVFGVTAAIYKERFFSALTVNVGIISEHGINANGGKDDFMMYTKGIASKTGYNFRLNYDDTIRLQPTINFSVSSIDMDAYTNGNGVKIISDGMTPVTVEPAVALVADMKNNLLGFINVNFVWNVNDEAVFTADDVTLPKMVIDPYVQYGIGVNKILSDKFSTRAEIFGRSMGRSGVGGQLSINWTF